MEHPMLLSVTLDFGPLITHTKTIQTQTGRGNQLDHVDEPHANNLGALAARERVLLTGLL